MTIRSSRLAHLLCGELESLFRDELSDPALGGIVVVSVELSPDGGHARVGYAVEGDLAEEAAARRRTSDALARATAFVRTRLATHLNLKRTPKLSFTFVGMVAPREEAR